MKAICWSYHISEVMVKQMEKKKKKIHQM